MCNCSDKNLITSLVEAEVTVNDNVADGHMRLELHFPAGENARPVPGQFIMLRVHEGSDPLLARPFGIAGYSKENDIARIEIFYRIVGKGTREMAQWSAGHGVKFLGPLGNSFNLPPADSRSLLIAGGIGLPPLLALVRYMDVLGRKDELTVLYGGKVLAGMVGVDVLEGLGIDVQTCTEDGSCGRLGLVTGLLSEYEDGKGSHLFVCGPNPMMLAVHKACDSLSESSQYSLESRMACGFGVCSGCAVAVERGEG
ncbi:MAG: dihydroorotate dehydrogenase electron transfer subunit, partial [bacterium]